MLTFLFVNKKQNPTNPNKQKTQPPTKTHITSKNKQGTSQHLPIKKTEFPKIKNKVLNSSTYSNYKTLPS